MNSIAGGGTLLTFPALVFLGVPPLAANATSTVALWPGAVASFWGYRGELAGARPWILRLALPSLLGGLAGALLLLWTPADRFAALAPWLVLGATALFLAQKPLLTAIRRSRGQEPDATGEVPLPNAALLGWQLVVGVYGGYFGAGIGILMLAGFGLLGLTNIHRMNGLKSFGGLGINVVAAATFATSSLVDWKLAGIMAAGALAGGYLGARLAQRVSQARVRQAIGAIGLGASGWLLWQQLG